MTSLSERGILKSPGIYNKTCLNVHYDSFLLRTILAYLVFIPFIVS